jgi:hypothetical protein
MVGKKYWYVMYYITYTVHHYVPITLFWAQMALASLVPLQGPKMSRFPGPTPSNAPRNDVAPLKIITYRAIKTTGTLIVSVVLLIANPLLYQECQSANR